MRVSRLVAVLGCVVVAGCAAGPADPSTAGTSTAGTTVTGSASPAPTVPAEAPTTGLPTTRPTCTGTGGSAPRGARLTSPGTVTGAWTCHGTTPFVATPAQARALATALALPTPPRRKAICADNIRFDAPVWYLTTSTGQVLRPAAPLDSCGRPIEAVQLAVAAVGAR